MVMVIVIVIVRLNLEVKHILPNLIRGIFWGHFSLFLISPKKVQLHKYI